MYQKFYMQGFADILVEKLQTSRATYEAVIELKYLNKEKAKSANYELLKEEGINQMKKYIQDKRLNEKENLKKFVIVFEGFDQYNVFEIN